MTNRGSSSEPAEHTTPAWRVAVVSPFTLHREALAATLRRSEAFAAVEEYAEAPSDGHDVTVVDVPAVGMSVVRDLVRRRPVLAWGGYLHTRTVTELVELGLRGYVSVIGAQRDLAVAAVRVASGQSSLPELASSTVRLTPAEQRVCRAYLVERAEASRAEVAAGLGISERTLKVHLSNVRAKLGERAANRGELARQLRARGVLDGWSTTATAQRRLSSQCT